MRLAKQMTDEPSARKNIFSFHFLFFTLIYLRMSKKSSTFAAKFVE